MKEITALWAPDIEPPASWLVPAILYQDKVATFSPEPYLDDRDGRASQRIQRHLGDLYGPVSLSSEFSRSGLIEDELRGRLPSWIATARRLDPGCASHVGRWADRAAHFEQRERYVAGQLHKVRRLIEDAKLHLNRSTSQLNQLQGKLRIAELELATLKAAARPQVEAAKLARREALAPLIEQIKTLSSGRQLLDRESDEYAEACLNLDEIRVQIQTTQRANSNPPDPHVEAAGKVVDDLRAKIKELQSKIHRQRQEVSRLERQHETQRAWINSPWGEKDRSSVDPGFSAGDLWNLPRELDTIAVGKVYGPVFRFLATYGGLWVATRRDRPYAGTLVGPSFVIDDIMMTIARHVAEDRPDLVLMVSEGRRKAMSESTDAAGLSVAVSWLLPVPRTSDLAAVRRFREAHAQELAVLRAYLRAPLSSADSPEALRDAIRDIDASCQDAAQAISRSLQLDKKTGLKYVRGSVISEVGASLRDTAVATGLGAISTVQASVNVGDALAGVPAGFLVAGVTLTAATAINSLRSRAARGRVPSPFLYSYEAVRLLDRDRIA